METWRVLKNGGIFIDCFYIRGKSGITDWLVKNILSKKGGFTPPFHTETDETAYSNLTKHVKFIRYSDLSCGECCHDEVIDMKYLRK